jgi:diguanylate cyclase (GGDEF)-like protein
MPTTTKRLSAVVLAPLLVLALAAPGSQPPAASGAAAADVASMDLDEAILHCLQTRGSEPTAAIGLAERLLKRADLDTLQRIKLYSCKGVAAAQTGDHDQANTSAEAIEAALADAPALDAADQLRAHSQVGRIYYTTGRIYQALQAYERTVDAARAADGDDAVRVQASTLNNIGLIHAAYLDSAAIADEHFRKAVELQRSIGEPPTMPLTNLGLSLARQGDHPGALKVLTELAASPALDNDAARRLRVASAIAFLDPALDGTARLKALHGLLKQQQDLPDAVGQSSTLAQLAELEVAQGQTGSALGHARQSLELARQYGSPLDTYAALDALAKVHLARGEADQALAQVELKNTMKLDNLRQHRLDMLAGLQSRNMDVSSQRELERLRYEDHIRNLEEQKEQTLRSAVMLTLLTLLVGSLLFALLQRRRRAQMQDLSERDALTGLANRHAATARLNALAAQPCGGETRNVLFLIDVDHFKQINDTCGHHAGDQVLVEISERLRKVCRPEDLVSRWGGEEFLVACSGLSPLQASAVAARLREAMAHTLHTSLGSREVTASLGLAPIPFFDAPDNHASRRWDYALRMADRALYAAKERRNAWVGYWGARLPEEEAIAEAILECPEAAQNVIEVMSSFPRDPDRPRRLSLREAVAQL